MGRPENLLPFLCVLCRVMKGGRWSDQKQGMRFEWLKMTWAIQIAQGEQNSIEGRFHEACAISIIAGLYVIFPV